MFACHITWQNCRQLKTVWAWRPKIFCCPDPSAGTGCMNHWSSVADGKVWIILCYSDIPRSAGLGARKVNIFIAHWQFSSVLEVDRPLFVLTTIRFFILFDRWRNWVRDETYMLNSRSPQKQENHESYRHWNCRCWVSRCGYMESGLLTDYSNAGSKPLCEQWGSNQVYPESRVQADSQHGQFQRNHMNES